MNGEAKFQTQRQGLGEDPSVYRTRIDRYSKLSLLIDLNSGTPASTLYEGMNPYKKETRFEATSDQDVDETISQRQPDLLIVTETPKGYSRRGGSHTSDDSPTPTKPNWMSAAKRMPRPSLSASNFGGETQSLSPEDTANRATEKTDNLVRQIIKDAVENSILLGDLASMKVPFKLSPPVFKGTDSIEEFLSFTKGLINYLAIHGYMKPETDSIQVRLLGHILMDKALRWFQQTINYGIDD
ncbi:hypothetical protein F5887DRAFT_1071702 [Amanita rubescens]|nr:hypothetical protein F5887DRAFT_1071702 [Amanita rubescens]